MQANKQRRFLKWTNTLEDQDNHKANEQDSTAVRIEYRGTDILEKNMETRVLVSTRHVSKGFMARKEKPIAKFGIGSGFEAERGNCGLTMVQRDNIWHPYYEVKMEEADLAAQYRQSQDAKKQGTKPKDIKDIED